VREGTIRGGCALAGARLWRVGVVLAFLVAIVGFGNTPTASASSSYVNTDVLNLRDDAGVWGNVITQMYDGDGISVLDGPTWDGWYYVDYWGTQGWAHGNYLIVNGKRGWKGDAPSTGGGSYSQPAVEKWIDINRSSSTVTLFEGDSAIATYYASLGWDTSDQGFYATASGTFYIYAKNADLTWTEWGQAYITHWMAFDSERANGFHSWSMDANGNVIPGGDGATGGCVALAPDQVAHIFNWAPEGTRVEVHW